MHQENQVLLFFLNYFIQEHFKKEEEKGNCQNNRIDLVLQLHFITRGDGDVKKPNHTRTRTVGYLGYHGSRIGWRKWPHIIAYGSSFSSFFSWRKHQHSYDISVSYCHCTYSYIVLTSTVIHIFRGEKALLAKSTLFLMTASIPPVLSIVAPMQRKVCFPLLCRLVWSLGSSLGSGLG